MVGTYVPGMEKEVMSAKVLIVEDEQPLAEMLAYNLEAEGFVVLQAESALAVAESNVATLKALADDAGRPATALGPELADRRRPAGETGGAESTV